MTDLAQALTDRAVVGHRLAATPGGRRPAGSSPC